MNLLNSTLILIASVIAVYIGSTFSGMMRQVLGAQIDLLPVLVIYAGLRSDVTTMALVAVLGGLCFDSLSANLLGVSIWPLFIVGFMVYLRRELILQEQFFARFVIGAAASAIAPLLTLLLLLSARQSPILGWGSLWQWLVMSVGGGLMTPVCFWLFDRLNHALSYRPVVEISFRADREIRRGRK